MIKVRFNLSRNKYYKFWKITFSKNHIVYYDPKTHDIVMENCKLKNYKKTAEKIFCGANKTVCAWIECEAIKISNKKNNYDKLYKISYNPRIAPYWTNNNCEDIDDSKHEKLIGINGQVFSNLNI